MRRQIPGRASRENQGLASQSAIAIAVALALLPSASRADKWPDCTYDTRSIEYAQCAIRELNKELTDLRQQMNDRYREVVAQIPAKAVDLRRHLEDAQTAWLRYATESCAFEGMTRGGSREAVEISTLECLSKETRARAGALGQIKKRR